MQITLDVNQPLTATERAVLEVLLGEGSRTPTETKVTDPAPAPKAEKPKKAPEPKPEPEITHETVAAMAQKLMKSGEREKVKAALDAVGVARVRELDDDQVVEFHKLLS